MPLIKLPKLPAFIGFQYLYFLRSLPITSCVHFVLISKLPPRCPTTTSCIHLASIFPVPLRQLPAVIWLYIWLHRGLPKVPPPVPLHSFPHSCGFNISASHRLSTASCMNRSFGVQYLDFRFSSQQLLAFILVSMSNFPPLPPASFSPIFCGHLASISTCSLPVSPSCMHLVSISKFPPPSSGIHFRVPKFPVRLSAIFCMYLHVSLFRFNV